MNTSLLFPKPKLAGSIIIQIPHTKCPARWSRPCFHTKSVDILGLTSGLKPQALCLAGAHGCTGRVLVRFPGVPGKCQDFRLFVDFENFTHYFKIISLLSSINELYKQI